AASIGLMVQTNFAGPAVALSESAEFLATQGKPATLLVLSSVAAARPRKSNFVYGSTKSGLDSFARGLGDALVGTPVRVVVLRPGFVRSRMTVGLEPAPFASSPEQVAVHAARVLGRRRSKDVVWVPAKLGPLFAVLTNLPSALWRKIAAER
ncbi:MAG: SDR family NAD(P)-dependent oxidoreductase, partial [Microthrixaceae bacterium]